MLLDDSIRVTTDKDGRFQFTGLVEGYYGLRIFDPDMSDLDLALEPTVFEVRPGEVASARLVQRSEEAVMTEACGPVELSDTEAILVGFALLDTGYPATGAQIAVRWVEFSESFGGFAQENSSLSTAELREDGFFRLCGVPRDRRLDIVSVWNGVESSPERFDIPLSRLVFRKDIVIRSGG